MDTDRRTMSEIVQLWKQGLDDGPYPTSAPRMLFYAEAAPDTPIEGNGETYLPVQPERVSVEAIAPIIARAMQTDPGDLTPEVAAAAVVAWINGED